MISGEFCRSRKIKPNVNAKATTAKYSKCVREFTTPFDKEESLIILSNFFKVKTAFLLVEVKERSYFVRDSKNNFVSLQMRNMMLP